MSSVETDSRAGAPAAPDVGPILEDPNPGLARGLLHAGYDLAWLLAIALASPWWVARSLLDREFRRMVRERLALGLGRAGGGRPRVLVHGVSVGEVKGAASLVRELEALHPGYEVVVSSTTYTGLEVARQLYASHQVVRFPIDLSWVVARFLRRLRPELVVLIELEIWPNFLRECNRAGIPVAVVNGRITARSFSQYHWLRQSIPQFNRISLFCVQLEEYAERFRTLAGRPERVLVTGNMKADALRVGLSQAQAGDLHRLLAPRTGQPVVVAGSTHAGEERILALAWGEACPEARLVLVPRHPVRADEVVKELAGLGLAVQRLTALRAGSQTPDPSRPALVDTIGELELVYTLADVVYVGGSLVPHGGQNMLEPAAQGRPVLHGPHVENFAREAALLERAGASRSVADREELVRVLRQLLADPELRERMAQAGIDAVSGQGGAARLTLEALQARCLAPAGGELGPRVRTRVGRGSAGQ